MVTANHCIDIKADRKTGSFWEMAFGRLAHRYGLTYSLLQVDRQSSIVAHRAKSPVRITLPDVTIWTLPIEHHEIKHKNPVVKNNIPSYGLEVYRFNALLDFAQETNHKVMYTIHDHDKAGGRENIENYIEHWSTVNILNLYQKWHTCGQSLTYTNGIPRIADIYYWSTALWNPLAKHLLSRQIR